MKNKCCGGVRVGLHPIWLLGNSGDTAGGEKGMIWSVKRSLLRLTKKVAEIETSPIRKRDGL